MEKKKKNPNLKARLVWLYIGSFLISIAPLVVILALNWGDYTKTPADTIKLCIGGIILVFFILLKVIGKLKMPNRVVLFGVVFLMSYLLQPIIQDMILLSGMALVGELLDLVCFQKPIKATKEQILVGKTATATTKQVEEVIKQYVGNGRV